MSSDVVVEEPKKKKTVKEFLQQYRRLALPNAKRFRKATKIAALRGERAFMLEIVRRAAALNAMANKIITDLTNESNFACHETVEGTPGIIEWIADDTALEAAKKYLKEFEK